MQIKLLQTVLLAAVFLLPFGCADKSFDSGKNPVPPSGVSKLDPAEQEIEAYEIFKQILDLSSGGNRQANLPRMKELYLDIIENCPDSWLAQESYLRLIIIAREEKTVQGDAEAERLYQEFLVKYPDSGLRKVLEYEARAVRQ